MATRRPLSNIYPYRMPIPFRERKENQTISWDSIKTNIQINISFIILSMMLSYMQHKKGEKLMKSIGSFIIAICIIFLNFLFFTGCPSNVENLPPNDIYTGNLILNPSCEDVLVGGEIPYWTEVLSTSWSQRAANPSPHDGSAYFFAGTEANAGCIYPCLGY